MKALVRSDILRSVKNGTIDPRAFNTREIIAEYGLAKVAADQRPKSILEKGDTILDMVLRIVREAEIID